MRRVDEMMDMPLVFPSSNEHYERRQQSKLFDILPQAPKSGYLAMPAQGA